VARKINQNEPRFAGQRGDLLMPKTQMTRPAVDEYQRLAALAGGEVMNPVRTDTGKVPSGTSHAWVRNHVSHGMDLFLVLRGLAWLEMHSHGRDNRLAAEAIGSIGGVADAG